MVQGYRHPPDAGCDGGGPLSHVTFSPTDRDINTALRSWLLTVVPCGFEVMQGQLNHVAPPPGPFVLFTPLFRRRLATNASRYTRETREVIDPMACVVQVSAFGSGSGEAVQRITALWRDRYAVDWLREASSHLMAPLHASEPRQTGFINSDRQYEDNWTADLTFQVNFTVSTPQDFATSITVDLHEVDASFPSQKE